LIDGREGMHMRLESILNGRPFSRLQTKVVLAGVVCAALAILPLARAERQAGSELDDPPATPTPRQVSQEEFEKRVQEEVTRRLADEEARLRTELELQRAKAGASSAELQRQLAERVASERARQSGEPLRIAGAIVPPSKLTDRRPVYPDEARKARVQGVVILELVVERDGSVSSARPLRSLPMGLTEAAIEAARSWRYQPATLDGQPVSVFLAAAVVFSIGGTPSADEAAALSAVRPDEDAAAGLPTPELREQARQQSVDALKRMGGPNAELLSELAEMLPKGSVLSKLSIGPDRSLRLSGTAANEADVAELMSTMQRSSRFASAELASVTRREQGSVEFEIRCPLVEDLQ
jgi:TonB family protein